MEWSTYALLFYAIYFLIYFILYIQYEIVKEVWIVFKIQLCVYWLCNLWLNISYENVRDNQFYIFYNLKDFDLSLKSSVFFKGKDYVSFFYILDIYVFYMVRYFFRGYNGKE